MKFIKKHKKLCIVLLILIIILIAGIFFIKMLSPDDSKNLYGNRLDGIENVRINEDRMRNMNTELKQIEGVESVSYDLRGRLVNLIIKVQPTVTREQARDYAYKTLEFFEENEKKYYDIQIFIVTNEESDIYPMIGYKHKTSENYVWKQE